MSCHDIEPLIIDFARGATSDRVREDALNRHLLGCPSCTGLIERERAMSAALRRLADTLAEPSANPRQEETLLLIFDRAGTTRRSHRRAPRWAGVAAAALILGTLGALVKLSTGRPSRTPDAAISTGSVSSVVVPDDRSSMISEPEPALETSAPARLRGRPADRTRGETSEAAGVADFVPWPGASERPPFESGELVLVTLPVDALPTLGMAPPAAAADVVLAEVLVGQDGFARAIRLVQ